MAWRRWWDAPPKLFRRWWRGIKSHTANTTNALYSSALKRRRSLTVYLVSAWKRPNGAWTSVWGGGRDEEDDHKWQTPRGNWGLAEHWNGLCGPGGGNRLRYPLGA